MLGNKTSLKEPIGLVLTTHYILTKREREREREGKGEADGERSWVQPLHSRVTSSELKEIYMKYVIEK